VVARTLIVVLAPIVLAIAVSMVVIALAGAPPVEAMDALLNGAFGGKVQLARTISFMLPLTLVALGWIVAFTARRVNVGLEGQIVMGGIAAAGVGLYLGPWPAPVHLAVGMLAAAAAGMLYGGIAAWLWASRHVNEIISTLLLNLIALEIVGWLVRGPMHEAGTTFPRSEPIAETVRWPFVIPHTSLSWAIVLAPVAVVVIWFVLRRTTFGMSLRITGANRRAAEYAGIDTTKVTVIALLVSAGMAGITGGALILGGETGRLSDGFSASLGFEGIVVALVARNNPWGVLPAALLFAVLESGSGLMETRVGVAAEVVLITQGIVILIVAGAGFLLDRPAMVGRAADA
jgi:simple sugar transport system permease protein